MAQEECKMKDEPLKCSYPHCICMSTSEKEEDISTPMDNVQMNVSVGELRKILSTTNMTVSEFTARLSHIKVQQNKGM